MQKPSLVRISGILVCSNPSTMPALSAPKAVAPQSAPEDPKARPSSTPFPSSKSHTTATAGLAVPRSLQPSQQRRRPPPPPKSPRLNAPVSHAAARPPPRPARPPSPLQHPPGHPPTKSQPRAPSNTRPNSRSQPGPPPHLRRRRPKSPRAAYMALYPPTPPLWLYIPSRLGPNPPPDTKPP